MTVISNSLLPLDLAYANTSSNDQSQQPSEYEYLSLAALPDQRIVPQKYTHISELMRDCAICFEKIGNPDFPDVKLNCPVDHIFHERCLVEWFKSSHEMNNREPWCCPVDNALVVST